MKVGDLVRLKSNLKHTSNEDKTDSGIIISIGQSQSTGLENVCNVLWTNSQKELPAWFLKESLELIQPTGSK